jgi:hypothetical protein
LRFSRAGSWVRGLGCIVGQAVFQKREGLGAELADVCGEAGKLIVGQDATAYVVSERWTPISAFAAT